MIETYDWKLNEAKDVELPISQLEWENLNYL